MCPECGIACLFICSFRFSDVEYFILEVEGRASNMEKKVYFIEEKAESKYHLITHFIQIFSTCFIL